MAALDSIPVLTVSDFTPTAHLGDTLGMDIFRSVDHRAHHVLELDGGRLVDSWEGPDRADIVDQACDDAGFTATEVETSSSFDRELAVRVHDPGYVAFLESAHRRWVDQGHTEPCAMAFGWPARRFRDVLPQTLEAQIGYYSFAADCSIGADTWTAVTSSAATAIAAADHVVTAAGTASAPVAFARCRPPGHHASRDQFGGYCYLNNSALAAQRLRDSGAGRVSIVDVDYHHGNGTQDIFYRRADVLHTSIHGDPIEEFPYFLGYADETGEGPGVNANRNLPLARGSEAQTWFEALDSALDWATGGGGSGEPADALVIPLGLDTYVDDPISHFRLQSHDYLELGRRLAGAALPTVIVLEGGYATEALGLNTVNVLTGYSDSV